MFILDGCVNVKDDDHSSFRAFLRIGFAFLFLVFVVQQRTTPGGGGFRKERFKGRPSRSFRPFDRARNVARSRSLVDSSLKCIKEVEEVRLDFEEDREDREEV